MAPTLKYISIQHTIRLTTIRTVCNSTSAQSARDTVISSIKEKGKNHRHHQGAGVGGAATAIVMSDLLDFNFIKM